MLKFTIQNQQVVLDPNVALIEEFQAVLNYDKKDKDLGNRMLLYVYYCCDLTADNPMRDLDYREKPGQAMSRAFQNKKKDFTPGEKKVVTAAMEAYNYFNETAGERSLLALDQKIDEIRTILENTEPEIIRNLADNGSVTFSSNDKILSSFAKQIQDLMNMKIAIAEASKKLENTGRVRGDKKSSILERGGLLRKKGTK
jgi:hypothetical protein